MIPKLHKKGRSFRGAANYLLHDKDRARSSDRVAWTATRNLATSDPHAAWRVMAATAMDQGRLKQAAGVKSTGRKSTDAVLHLTLSWHPDEAEGLSRDEMMRAASGALRALGADNRQALFVSHDDEPQPHVHVLVNRVSPSDGRMLPSSKEKLHLSRWAQSYEEERGATLCEQRVINNAARDRGEYTRGDADTPRHIHELQAANDNTRHPPTPEFEKTKSEQKRLDLSLARKTRELEERHARQVAELVVTQKRRRQQVIDQGRRDALKARELVRDAYRCRWKERYRERRSELQAFERREGRLLGRVSNALRSTGLGGLRTRSKRISDVYNTLSTEGGRRASFEEQQSDRDRVLEWEQRAAEIAATAPHKARSVHELAELRTRFLAERAGLILQQELERAGNRAKWRTRRKQRVEAFAACRAEHPPAELGHEQLCDEFLKVQDELYRERSSDRDHER